MAKKVVKVRVGTKPLTLSKVTTVRKGNGRPDPNVKVNVKNSSEIGATIHTKKK